MPTDPPPTDPWDAFHDERCDFAWFGSHKPCSCGLRDLLAAERQQATAQQVDLRAEVARLTEINAGICADHNYLLVDGARWQARAEQAEAECQRYRAENEQLRGALDTQLRISTEHWQVIETQRKELARLQRPWRSRVERAEGVAFLVADAVDPRDADIARLTAIQTSLEAEVASLTQQLTGSQANMVYIRTELQQLAEELRKELNGEL